MLFETGLWSHVLFVIGGVSFGVELEGVLDVFHW